MRLSSRPDVLRLKAKRDVDGLVQALGYRADSKIQQAASDALIDIGAPAIPALIHALSSPILQESVMEILRNIGVLSIDPLINVIKTDERELMRKSAVKVLADIGMFAIEPLTTTLMHNDPGIRKLAVDALLMIGSLAVEPLITHLNNKNQPLYVRLDAIKALMKLGGSQATSALLVAAQNDPSAEVRKSAADALGRQVILPKSAAPSPSPASTTRQRGLSQRLKERGKKKENQYLTDELKSRWSRVQQELPRLQPIAFDALQQLLHTHAVHRRYAQPIEVLADLNKEFSQYSRIKDSTYTAVSIRLVFDNEVSQAGRVIPATRQQEVIIAKQENQYHLFINAAYIEHFW